MLNMSRKQERSQSLLLAFMAFSLGIPCCFETEPGEMSLEKEGMPQAEAIFNV